MDILPALLAGGLLIIIAAAMAWFQWRYRQPNPADDELTRHHALRQLRRRLQVSALIALVGLLIPLGDLLPLFRQPFVFACFWLALLALSLWIMLLAVADLTSARLYHRRASQQISDQRRRLERELERYRAQGNGHSTPET